MASQQPAQYLVQLESDISGIVEGLERARIQDPSEINNYMHHFAQVAVRYMRQQSELISAHSQSAEEIGQIGHLFYKAFGYLHLEQMGFRALDLSIERLEQARDLIYGITNPKEPLPNPS